MPRDGSNIYHRPVGTDAVTDTTIESTKYNSNVADVEQDLNLPRPIVAGGTGANNAHDAMIALSGEIAGQGPVTNYASFPFVAGSFYSQPGATDAPDGATSAKYFDGICYTDPGGGIVLEARDVSIAGVGTKYARHKAGTWSAWVALAGSIADLDAAYVNVAGDVMTGPLTLRGNGHWKWDSPAGAGSYYDSYNTVDRFFVGTDNATDNFRIYAAGFAANAVTVGGTGNVAINSATASASPSTGALTGGGGGGGGGALNVAQTFHALSVGTPQGLNAAFSCRFDPNSYSGVEISSSSAGTAGSILGILNNAGGSVAGWSWAASQAAINVSGVWKHTDTTASTSPTTGALTVAGGVGVGAAINVAAKGNVFGYTGGTTANLPVAQSDANILFYNLTAANWNGIGSDGNGHMWFRTGNSGTPVPAMWLSASDQAAHFASTTATTSPTTGALTVAGGIGASGIIYGGSNIVLGGTGAAGTGALFFGNSGSKFLTYDGSNVYTLSGGLFQGGSGYQCRAGQSAGGYGTNVFNLYYPGVQLWIDVTNLGNITVTSDYRIKKDVLDLPGMWDTVKALRPIKYTQADFTPPAQIEHNAKLKAEGKEVVQTPMFVADTIERWGFIAHELQETLVESAATGVKDSPDHVQSPNMATVVAALTKALQEAMARIEALEAK